MPADDAAVTRRAFLTLASGAAAAAAATACTGGKSDPAPTGSASGSSDRPAPTPGPEATSPAAPVVDPVVVAGAVNREVKLIAAYDAAIAALPSAAAVLSSFKSHHEAHLSRLTELSGAPEPTASSPLPSFASTSTPTTQTARAVYAALAAKEDAAADSGAAACAKAGPGEFATLLAQIAGSEAQHGTLLPTFPAPVAS